MNAVLKLRPRDDDDQPFLTHLFALTVSERLRLWHWDAGEAQKIVDQQFHAHSEHYRQLDEEKSDVIIELDDQSVGRMLWFHNRDEIRLADISLLPECRGRGIGTAAIETLKSFSVQGKRPLRLHVEKFSNAVRLYLRQGFYLLEDRETHLYLEWHGEGMTTKKTFVTA
ncbi:MAG: GNAT family N-acetyltransferase [Verrucomicrobiota bacterium]